MKDVIRAVNLTIDAFPTQMMTKNGKQMLTKWKTYINTSI